VKAKSFNFFLTRFILLGTFSVLALPSVSLGARATVTAGCTDSFKCPGGTGFVDDLSGSGGFGVTAQTRITRGDIVHWHFDAGEIHTVTSQPSLGSGFASSCGTGEMFDSGFLFTPEGVFERSFSKPGSCAYYCQAHGVQTMQGEVMVADCPAGGCAPTTTVQTTTTTTTTRPLRPTTTTRPCERIDRRSGRTFERCRPGSGR
jgi:plastocyanin